MIEGRVQVDDREIFRYLGYGDQCPDQAVLDLIDAVKREVAGLTPRSVYQSFDCQVEEVSVTIGGVVFGGRSLARHLEGCGRVVVFAATLGAAADLLVKRHSVLDMSRAAVAQAVLGAWLEAYCDLVQARIAETAAEQGLFLRPRFSPGYGDLELAAQRSIFDLLALEKRLGVSLTDSLMMIPTKSVTALIGLTAEEQGCAIHKCAACANLECPFRVG